MASPATEGVATGVRLMELLGSISLATDLGTGQPAGHALRTAVIAARIAEHLGLDDGEVDVVRQVALLRFLGCTADSADAARMVGGDELAFRADMAPTVMAGRPTAARRLIATLGAGEPALRRARLVAGALVDRDGMGRSLASHCEVAARLATRLGMTPAVIEAVAHGYERWDGDGFPSGLAGEAIPSAIRIAIVARDADLLWRTAPTELDTTLRARRGSAYDPAVVDAFTACGRDLLAETEAEDPWPAAVADSSHRVLRGERLDRALAAVGDFADLKSPWTRGHSARVADLAAEAAAYGAAAGNRDLLRRAAWVADLGRVGVPNGTWDRPGRLTVADQERVRLHPYLTERILARCPSLAPIGRLAAAHHERLDGSGYHRAVGGGELDYSMRLLAVADAVAAMGEARPHRAALSPSGIVREIERDVRIGRLDPRAAEAVLATAGHQAPPRGLAAELPCGLTGREAEVLRHVARGRTNREIAATLHLSAKTVGRHVENLYAKIGVSSRAAAALFAMEHRLLDL